MALVESWTPVFQVKYFIQKGEFYINDVHVVVKIEVIFCPSFPPPKENKKMLIPVSILRLDIISSIPEALEAEERRLLGLWNAEPFPAWNDKISKVYECVKLTNTI